MYLYLLQLEAVQSGIQKFQQLYTEGINWGFQLGLAVLAASTFYVLLVKLFS